jgi:hypothetical protein
MLARDLRADGWLSKSTPVADLSRRLRAEVERARAHERKLRNATGRDDAS